MNLKLNKFVFLPGLVMGMLILLIASARAGTATIKNSVGMEFILVRPGVFMMGSPETEPHRKTDETLHRVVISKPFYLQTTEVTIKQWQAVMGVRIFGRKKGRPDFPVTRVSFFDCQNFIKKLNSKDRGRYRLPTEAEWEYAARARRWR